MPSLRSIALAAIAAGAALSLPARAQSLLELYEAARAYDAAYLAAVAQAQSAEHRVRRAEGLLLMPQASLKANAQTQFLDLPRAGSGDSHTIGASVQGRYPLINRSNHIQVEQARKGLLTAAADLEAAEQDLIVRLATEYFDVLGALDTLASAQANKKAIAEQLASAKRGFEVGTLTITDTREAQARFDLATAAEIAAENDLRTKRIALDQLVGKTGVLPKGLATPVALPPTMPANVEDWVGAADSVHPAVRKARVGLEVATLETANARAADAYTVDAIGSLGFSRAGGGAATLPGVTKQATVGVEFNLPLYTGGANQARVRETLLLEDRARQDLENARRTVAQSTRQVYFGVQSGQARARALEAAESSNKLALEATQLGYRVGVRVNLDVLNAQSQLYQTQTDLAKQRYDVLVNGLKLRQASGQLGRNDVEAVNRLLAK
jgi:outer membrane protein